MIAIVDYGVGNLRSLKNALSFLGYESKLVSTPPAVRQATKLILPGVGAFGFAMQNIEKLGLRQSLIEQARAGVPVLGICLGMQLLFSTSFEGGEQTGLDLIPGKVKKITGALKVPHMGWNRINTRSSPLLKSLEAGGFGYFVHSYYCEPLDADAVIATTEYGATFAAAVERENIFGVQFHPEKSQELGLQILRNFSEL